MKALYRHDRKGLPYSTDLNIFTGCSGGCIYCYARARYAGRRGCPCSDFEKSVPRYGIAEALDREFRAIREKGEKIPVVNLGGSCDSYQAAEAEAGIMRQVLEIMIKYRVPAVLSTKSCLIQRDIDLIEKLASAAGVNASLTITTEKKTVAERLEPGASPPYKRFDALKELSAAGITTGLHWFPVIPFLADSAETVDAITDMAAESGCSYIMPAFLYLHGGIRKMFLEEAAARFPGLESEISSLYPRGSADPAYKKNFYSMFFRAAGKKKLCADYRKFLPPCDDRAVKGGGQNLSQPELAF